jgi:adenine C2-methylase RlmN of 23S rRNA A2503 and tRNA A37
MIGLPLYEMIRGAEESKEKSKKLEDKLKRIDEQMELIKQKELEEKELEQKLLRIPQ